MKETESLSETYNLEYWNEFYKQVILQDESSFCGLVKKMIGTDTVILDIGCGSGRDTYSFAKDGYEVIGLDRSEEAIKLNNNHLREISNESKSTINFYVLDISDELSLSQLIQELSKTKSKKIAVYVRFLLHSINEITEEILLTVISKYLRKGDYLAAEYRTLEDKNRSKIFDNHYRRFIDAEKLLNDLETKYNFNKILFVKGTGLSLFNDEDPYLGRMIMEKN
jgi:tellurite methyltransferase